MHRHVVLALFLLFLTVIHLLKISILRVLAYGGCGLMIVGAVNGSSSLNRFIDLDFKKDSEIMLLTSHYLSTGSKFIRSLILWEHRVPSLVALVIFSILTVFPTFFVLLSMGAFFCIHLAIVDGHFSYVSPNYIVQVDHFVDKLERLIPRFIVDNILSAELETLDENTFDNSSTLIKDPIHDNFLMHPSNISQRTPVVKNQDHRDLLDVNDSFAETDQKDRGQFFGNNLKEE